MSVLKLSIAVVSVVIMLSGCDEHLDRIVVTAPESGMVVTLTNGSSSPLREVKVRVISTAYEEPWRDVPDLQKRASIPIDLAKAVEYAHHPNMPPGITFTVQMSQAHQNPQFRSWDFREDSSPSGAVRLAPLKPQVQSVGN